MDAEGLEVARKNGLVLGGHEAAGVYLRNPDGSEVLVNNLPCIEYVEGEYVLRIEAPGGVEIAKQLLGIRYRALDAKQADLDAATTQAAALLQKARAQDADLEKARASVARLDAQVEQLTERLAQARASPRTLRHQAAALLGRVVKALEG